MARKIPVLLVEQDDNLRESIKNSLGSDGFKVYPAADTSSCIEAVLKHKLRLILLSLTDGLEDIVSELKSDSRTSRIPVIILTETDSTQTAQQLSQIGADGHIAKPSNSENLAQILKLKLENCEAEIKQMQKQTGRFRRIPVLIIDDEDDIRRLIKYRLYHQGFEVYTAADGPTGIEAARCRKPQLILLDWMMPGMDGLEVLFNLKCNKRTRDIPVFMLTAKSTMEDMDNAFAKGADDYLTKPFDGERLGQTIREKLKKLKKSRKHTPVK